MGGSDSCRNVSPLPDDLGVEDRDTSCSSGVLGREYLPGLARSESGWITVLTGECQERPVHFPSQHL